MFRIFCLAWAIGNLSAESRLPSSVMNAEKSMYASVARSRAIYVRSVKAEVSKAQAILQKEKEIATRAGKLELALAIKKKQDEIVLLEVLGLSGSAVEELDNENLKLKNHNAILGEWLVTVPGYSAIWNFKPNGRVQVGADESTRWKVSGNNVIIGKETMEIPSLDENVTTGINFQGLLMRYERVKRNSNN